MWILLIIVVHANNPNDIPGWSRVPMPNQAVCEQARADMTAWLKFESFRIQAQCLYEPSSSSPTTPRTK